jgi:hypothetical protein
MANSGWCSFNHSGRCVVHCLWPDSTGAGLRRQTCYFGDWCGLNRVGSLWSCSFGSSRQSGCGRGFGQIDIDPQAPQVPGQKLSAKLSFLASANGFSYLRQSSSSTNAADSRQPAFTLTNSSRKTFFPSSLSRSIRAAVPISFNFWPPFPIRIAFCPSRSQ